MAEKTRRGIVLRIDSEGVEKVKAALLALGVDGERTLKRIENASRQVGPGLRSIDIAAKQLRSNVSGEFKQLSGNIVGLLSPVGLLTTGFSALIGVVTGWVTSALAGSDNLVSSTEELEERVARLRDVYGQASRAADELTEAERVRFLNDAQNDQRAALEDYSAALTELQRRVSLLNDEQRALFDANATGTVVELDTALARLGTTTDDVRLDQMVADLRDIIAPLIAADESVARFEAQVALLNGTATEAQRQLLGLANAADRFGAAMDGLAGIALPQLSDRQQVDALFADAMANATTDDDRFLASQQRRDALRRIAAEEAAKAAEEAQRAGERNARAQEQEQRRLEGIARTILGDVNPALAAKLALEQQLADIAAAQSGGFLAPGDAELARAAAQREFNAALDAAPVEKLEQIRDFTRQLIDDFRAARDEGKSVWESLEAAADKAIARISDRLLDLALDLAFGAIGDIISGSGGGGGIIAGIGALFGGAKATGGLIPAGRWGMAGERGPEPVFAGPHGALVLPSRGGSSGGGNGGTIVQVIAPPGSQVREERSRGPDGRELVRIMIRNEVGGMIGRGDFDGQFGSRFGMRPNVRRRS